MARNGTRLVVFILIPILVLVNVTCTVRKVQRVDPAIVTPASEDIVGVTTIRAEEVAFDPPGGVVRDGVVRAQVKKQDYTIPLTEVQRLWVARTETSAIRTIGLVAGVAAGSLLVLAAIVAATKQSCPFVYSWNGSRYVFDAEPYGGAISAGLEKDDYSELENLVEQKGKYRLRLTNEVDETQFTNFIELWLVDHSANVRVAADEYGGLYGLSQPRPLLTAHDALGNDLLSWLRSRDNLIWEPEAVPDARGGLQDEIILTFWKPDGASRGLLVANAATGLWGSLMIKRLVELRGNQAPAWLASMAQGSAGLKEMHDWITREGLYVLEVEVDEPGGWKVRGAIPGGGPLVAEDRVIPLDISQARGEQIRIRLRPPRGFWALNSFAMHYDASEALEVTRVRPDVATAVGGVDVLPQLLASDDRYYSMPTTLDRAELEFPAPPPKPGMKRTVLLHTRGWYMLHLNTTEEPATSLLQKIVETPGEAARFAAAEYARWRTAQR